MADELKASPVKREWALKLANALRTGREYANQLDIPYLGGAGDVFLGKAPEGFERVAYDEPLTSGAGWTTRLRPETIDMGFLIADAAPAGKTLVNALRKGTEAASTSALRKITGNAAATPSRVIDEIQQMNLLPSIVGKTSKEAPQAQALREAEEYGQKLLGLPPGNTPMDRAIACKYIDPSYHGTKKDIKNFDLSYHGTATDPGDFGEALYSSANPNIAGNYAESTMRGATNEGANIMPLMVRRGEQMQVEGMKGMEPLIEKAGGLENWFDLSPKEQAKIAQDMGFTSVRDFGYPQTANYDLGDVRSKFAAFDPRYFGKPGLMLGAGGLGVYGAMQGEDEYK